MAHGHDPARTPAARLHDRLVEQPPGERRDHQGVDRAAARRLAEDRDIARVAPECRDVPLHPAQRRDLVEIAVVAERAARGFLRECRVREEAKAAQAVVEAHEDEAAPRELRAVVHGRRAAAVDEAAAVDPHHHRQLRRGRLLGRPDVEVQAVLARWRAKWRRVAREGLLHAVVRVGARRAHAVPGGRGPRGAPAQIARGRRRERHAFPGDNALAGHTRHEAALGADRSRGGLERSGQGEGEGQNGRAQRREGQQGLLLDWSTEGRKDRRGVGPSNRRRPRRRTARRPAASASGTCSSSAARRDRAGTRRSASLPPSGRRA